MGNCLQQQQSEQQLPQKSSLQPRHAHSHQHQHQHRKKKRVCGPISEKSKDRYSRKGGYEIGRTLGRGHFAEVHECVRRDDGKRLAVKVIEKEDIGLDRDIIETELDVLRTLAPHPNIVNLHDVFEDDEALYLVMDLCEGGDLFTRITHEGKYSEKRAASVARQLAEALLHLHTSGVVHRDLKPENILLISTEPDSPIKICDFGLAKIVVKGQPSFMHTVCGTWAYCAPEVIARAPYNYRVDHWALGVLLYILLAGFHPFDVFGDLPEPDMLKKISECDFTFDDSVWSGISDEPKRLIQGLLRKEASHRLSLKEFLQSPWISEEEASSTNQPELLDRLNHYHQTRQYLRNFAIGKVTARRLRRKIASQLHRNPSAQVHVRRTLSNKWNIFEDAGNVELPAPILDMPTMDDHHFTESSDKNQSAMLGSLLEPGSSQPPAESQSTDF